MDYNRENIIDSSVEKDFDRDYQMVPMSMSMGVDSFEINQGDFIGLMPEIMDPEGTYGFMRKPPMVEFTEDMFQYEATAAPSANENMRSMNINEHYEEEELKENFIRKKDQGPGEVERILIKMERYNPWIFRELRMYGIPYQVARRIVKKIIRLTLIYSED